MRVDFLERRRVRRLLSGLLSWAVSTLAVVYLLRGSRRHGWRRPRHCDFALDGEAKPWQLRQTAVQTAAPSLNSVSDPMAAIESNVRSASGGQDPAALRDAASTAVRAALTGDPAQQAAANDKAAEALAKAQNISKDGAKAQVDQYQQQYKETVQDKAAGQTGGRYCGKACIPRRIVRCVGPLAGCPGRVLCRARWRSDPYGFGQGKRHLIRI